MKPGDLIRLKKRTKDDFLTLGPDPFDRSSNQEVFLQDGILAIFIETKTEQNPSLNSIVVFVPSLNRMGWVWHDEIGEVKDD